MDMTAKEAIERVAAVSGVEDMITKSEAMIEEAENLVDGLKNVRGPAVYATINSANPNCFSEARWRWIWAIDMVRAANRVIAHIAEISAA